MTMHNDAQVGEIAERIVLVGDPNRAGRLGLRRFLLGKAALRTGDDGDAARCRQPAM